MSNPPFPPAGAAPEPPRKKTSPLVWILGGIALFILLLGGAAIVGTYFLVSKAKQAGLDPDLMERNPGLAVAKMIGAMNPEIEVVSVDDKKGVITFKEKATGKTVTVNFEDAKQGKVRFTGDNDEEVTVETDSGSGVTQLKSAGGSFEVGGTVRLPSWVPSYPGANPQGTYSTEANDGHSAAIHFSTRDAFDQVAGFYESGLKSSGLKVTTNLLRQNAKGGSGMIAGQDNTNGRNVVITLETSEKGTEVNLVFTEKSR